MENRESNLPYAVSVAVIFLITLFLREVSISSGLGMQFCSLPPFAPSQ